MTIFLLTDGIPPYVIGGMQKHSRLITEYLATHGVKVVLYHCYDPDVGIEDNEVLQSFTPSAQPNITIRSFPYRDRGKLPGHYLRAQRTLAEQYFASICKEILKPDFIYTKGFVGSVLLDRRHELAFDCKIGVKFHGMNMFQSQPDLRGFFSKFMLRSPVKKLMNQADCVFSYGGQITNIISQNIRDSSKIIEIPAGIEESVLLNKINDSRSTQTRFVFIGRYDRVKGLPELYQAIEKLPESGWTLDFIGPIPLERQVQHTCVTYHGKISDQASMFEIVDACDVLICPSISEGMPNVILEAMARGLAILATDVGATSLLVKQNGRLIPPQSTDQLIDGLKWFIDRSTEEIAKMKQASLTLVRDNFTWERVIHKLLEFLSRQ